MTVFNRYFLGFLTAFAAGELLSLLGYFHPGLGHAVALGIAGVTLALALVNPHWGVYILLGELFVGGKGYLFSVPLGQSGVLSIRMVLFLIVLGVGVSHFLLRHRSQQKKALRPSAERYWTLAFAAILAYGIINGLANHPFAQVFFDANGWLFFFLLPVVTATLQGPAVWIRLVQLLAAAMATLAVKSVTLLYLFGHGAGEPLLPLYQWVRDTGVGEITPVSGTLFRVFFQSHVYSLIGLLVILTLLVHRVWHRWSDLAVAGAVLYLGSLTLLISQSRSLWIGGVVGVAVVFGHAVARRTMTVAAAVLTAVMLVGVLASQLTAVNLISGNAGGNVIASRFTNLGLEPASSTRKSQFAPLVAAIQKHPWLGSGLGQSVTYQSADPRVVLQHPGGWYTTTAFEWGYLDIALKLGLVGLTVYAIWIARVVWRGLTQRPTPAGPVPAAIIIGLIGVAVTNVFSPYLNHPLGIGWFMIAFASVAATSPAATPVGRGRTPDGLKETRQPS